MDSYNTKKTFPNRPARVALSQYQNNAEVSLSPIERLIKTYDAAIFNLRRGDVQKSSDAITELVLALNFHKSAPANVKEIASGFLNIYEYCRACVRKNKLEAAANLLQELRDAWEESFKRQREEQFQA
ncbi:MAG: hypothetical protein AAB071_00670 [Bacteroidota bacterium]